MELKNKSIVVTGGLGFIGSHLVDKLIQENPESLTVLGTLFIGKHNNIQKAKENFPDLKIEELDITNYKELKSSLTNINPDIVFHLATIPIPASLEKPMWSCDQNIQMSLNLCELARKDAYKTLIQYSTSEVYGTAREVPMKESHPIDPRTPYAASKAAADHIAVSYHRTFGLDVSIPRPFNNYGPRQNAEKYAALIPATIKRMSNNEDVKITGDGSQTRDFVYVNDTIDATIKLAKSKIRGTPINISSGKETSVKEIVQELANLLDYKKEFIYEPSRPGDVKRHIGDSSKAKELLEFTPKVEIKEGLKNTVDWYKIA